MKRSLALSVGLLFALGCADSVTEPGDDELEPAFNAAPAADFTIDPSGDLTGVTDADAIEQALIAAGPGDVIELAAGTFYVGRTLIAPAGFGGTLRGAGKDETTIMGVGTGSAPFGNALINFPGGPGFIDGSAFFFFPQPSGHVAVSGLAILLPDNFVTEPDPFGGTDLTAFIVVQLGPDDCNTSFTDLRLQGTATTNAVLPWFVHQPLWGIGVTGWDVAFPSFSSGGHHAVKGSDVSRVGIQALVHQMFRGASVEIADNTLTAVKQVITRWLDGANVSITGNTMNTYSWGGIVVTQEGVPVPGDLSNVVIRGNDVSTIGYAGIEIGWIPLATQPDFNLLIEKNQVFKAGPDPIGMFANVTGMLLDSGQDGAMVRNNIIRGDGFAGIAMFDVTNSAFIGNNLQGFTPIDADYVLFGWFGSNDNTIVGVGNGTVLDFGSGNIITGLTRAQGDESVGERIKAAQEKRRKILAAMGSYWP
jgi:hypothetical protein